MKKGVKQFILNYSPSWIKEYAKFRIAIINNVPFKQFLKFKFKRNKSIYWPVHKNSEVTHPQNIYVGINSNVGTRSGCYIQGNGSIWIGNYVKFATNIGIISGNHGLYNDMIHDNKEVRIDDYCWIGMNAVILPGVHLGPRTIVGAGSIVTKSFPEGYCVIGGNPARKIKDLEKEKFIPTKSEYEFYGYVPKKEFKKFAQRHLKNNKYYSEIMTKLEKEA